jgi:hypothetical protein
MLRVTGYDPGAGLSSSPSVLYLLVTGDNGPGTEGPLGAFRSADSRCNR